jgi:pimeloyl-ACP methyl ester carboxylesterase
MTEKIFLHGVPDTPEIWRPLFEMLDLDQTPENAPTLPGFAGPPPNNFGKTKEAYVNWYITHIKSAVNRSGPVDLIAHDWGALITLRVISLRPDLIRSWTIISAVPHPDNLWHSTAKMWQTPIIGEFMMLSTTKKRIEALLKDNYLPPDLAEHEAAAFGPHMRKSILNLYRSAKILATEWYPNFVNLPQSGLILWGEKDKFSPAKMGKIFAQRYNLPFIEIENTGHWPFVQNPKSIANHLNHHWAEAK